MAVNGYFFNAILDGETYDRVYNAEDFVSYLDKIVGSGVFPTPSDQLQVRASSGMDIIVNEGEGWINGHKLVNTADLTLTVDASDVLLGRIDRVIFYADNTERAMGIEILKGTAAVNPTAPALTRNDNRYEMCLAQITVGKGVTTINNSMISDTRANSQICGWVAGLIQQVDTSTLFTQWDTAYSEFMAQMESRMTTLQEAYDDWFSTLTEELQVGAYIKTFNKVVVGGSNVSNIIPLNIEGYEYDSTDVFLINLNGLMLTETYDYLLDTRDTPVELHINAQLTSGNRIEIRILKSVLGTPTELDGDSVEY